MSEYKNGGDNNMLWEQGSQVRILVPRHRKPRSYRNVTPFFICIKSWLKWWFLPICFNQGLNRCFNQHQRRDVAVVKWRP